MLIISVAVWLVGESLFKLKNDSNQIIFSDMPTVKFSICSQIYSKNTLLDQRPTRMMIMVGVFDKNIVIAPPDLTEWRPTSLLVKPSISSPIRLTVAFIQSQTCGANINTMLPLGSKKLQTFESIDKSG